MTGNLTWIFKELITACIKREAKSKLYTLETRDKDKNNETLRNMHANLTRQRQIKSRNIDNCSITSNEVFAATIEF